MSCAKGWDVLMPDWGSAVVDRLLEDEAVAQLIGERVDWTRRPQADGYPAIVLQTISDPRPDHFMGADGFRQTRLQLDAYSTESAADATRIAEAAIDALREPVDDASGIRFDRAGVDGPTDGGDQLDDVYVHWARVDFLLWHALASEEE